MFDFAPFAALLPPAPAAGAAASPTVNDTETAPVVARCTADPTGVAHREALATLPAGHPVLPWVIATIAVLHGEARQAAVHALLSRRALRSALETVGDAVATGALAPEVWCVLEAALTHARFPWARIALTSPSVAAAVLTRLLDEAYAAGLPPVHRAIGVAWSRLLQRPDVRTLLPRLIAAEDAAPFGPLTTSVQQLLVRPDAGPDDVAAVLAAARTPRATWHVMNTLLYPVGRDRPAFWPLDLDPSASLAGLAVAETACASDWSDPNDRLELTTALLQRTIASAPPALWARVATRVAETFHATAFAAPGSLAPVAHIPTASPREQLRGLLAAWWRTHRLRLAPDDLTPFLASSVAGVRDWGLACLATAAPPTSTVLTCVPRDDGHPLGHAGMSPTRSR